jgi:hypothetical protein
VYPSRPNGNASENQIDAAIVLARSDVVNVLTARHAQRPAVGFHRLVRLSSALSGRAPYVGESFDGNVSKLGRFVHDVPLDGNGA